MGVAYPDNIDFQAIAKLIFSGTLDKPAMIYQIWLILGFLAKQMVGEPDQITPIGDFNDVNFILSQVGDPKVAKFLIRIFIDLLLKVLV